MSKNNNIDIYLSLNELTLAAYRKVRAKLRRDKSLNATDYWLKVGAIDAAFDKRYNHHQNLAVQEALNHA